MADLRADVRLLAGSVSLAAGIGLLVARIYVTWGVWHPYAFFHKQLLVAAAIPPIAAGAVLLDLADRGGRPEGIGWIALPAAAVAGLGLVHFRYGFTFYDIPLILAFAAGLAAALVPDDPERSHLPRDAAVAVAVPVALVGGRLPLTVVSGEPASTFVKVGAAVAGIAVANALILLRRSDRSGAAFGRLGLANAAGAGVLFATMGAEVHFRPPYWAAFLVVAVPLALVAWRRGAWKLAVPTLALVPLLFWVEHQLIVYLSNLGVV